jgi:bifunctional non-homologous end joining protein LigD
MGQITHWDLALPETCTKPFTSTEWVFEVKYDGYRCLGRNVDGHAQLLSREGRDLSDVFAEVTGDLSNLPEGTAIDGELVVLDDLGRPLFERLLERSAAFRFDTALSAAVTRPATFFAWDILMLSGQDLRRFPLLGRKVALNATVCGLNNIHVASHVAEHGERLYAETAFMELDGIVAKRVDSSYTAGRTRDWLEIRTTGRTERNRRQMTLRGHKPGSSATTSEV